MCSVYWTVWAEDYDPFCLSKCLCPKVYNRNDPDPLKKWLKYPLNRDFNITVDVKSFSEQDFGQIMATPNGPMMII